MDRKMCGGILGGMTGSLEEVEGGCEGLTAKVPPTQKE